MVDSPEMWAYIVANAGLVAISGCLTGLSVLAYYRSRGLRSYAVAGAGFACIILSGLSELLYAFWIEPEYLLTRSEFLVLQAGEDVIITLGLALLFVAITRHRPASRADTDPALGDAGDQWVAGSSNDD